MVLSPAPSPPMSMPSSIVRGTSPSRAKSDPLATLRSMLSWPSMTTYGSSVSGNKAAWTLGANNNHA
eukprot:8771655-Alexandrium_andersonii.AAC.1